MDVSEALNLIKDGDTVAIAAASLIGYPEYVVRSLEERYKETKSPRGLTLVAANGHGIHDHRGDSRFGYPGFLKRIICTHPDTIPPVRKMIEANEIEGYTIPQGILNQLYRCIASKQAGVLSKIGMGTYIDPRQDGGKLNSLAKEAMVELIELHGEEWLFYKAFPINVALIRATTADEKGNLTIEREALKLELLEVALAAHASKGKVIVQVEGVTANGSLNSKDVVVPGELVDAVVIVKNPMEDHKQTIMTYYSPYFSGELKMPPSHVAAQASASIEVEDIVSRRAAFELFPGALVNVGVGIGAGVGPVAAVEGIADKLTLTLEHGVFGGTPTPLPDFGVSLNPGSFVSPATMFDFYHGGGLDITFLGAAQVDRAGNVNVSKFGNRTAGQGGFIDISQSSSKVVYCTYFKAKGFNATVCDGKLTIDQEGQVAKFVNQVNQITFNGACSVKDGIEVIFVTERAVFKLVREGLVLTEIAPGINLEKDILGNMEFKPIISKDLKVMDERIFRPGRMGCFD